MSANESIKFFGYLGFGDQIHMRPFVIDALKRFKSVFVVTPYPDLLYRGTGVKCLPQDTNLKNQKEEIEKAKALGLYEKDVPKTFSQIVKFEYGRGIRMSKKPILESFNEQFQHSSFPRLDLRFPIAEECVLKARKAIPARFKGKPLCVVKLPTIRREWANYARNPHMEYMERIIEKIRGKYCIVSVGDLRNGAEWLDGKMPQGIDVVLHNAELSIDALCGLYSIADLNITCPSNGLLIGVALDIPTFAIFGGYSPSRTYTDPLKLQNYGFASPRKECCCLRNDHKCDKEIDLTVLDKEFEKFMGRPKKNKAVEVVSVAEKKETKEQDKKMFWRFNEDTPVYVDVCGKMYVNVVRHGVERVQFIGTKDVLYRE